MCRSGEKVDLVREPQNPVDPRAIAVYSERGIQIGYVRAERAALIGAAMRNGMVRARFEQPEAWGATIRVSLDGSEPLLSRHNDVSSADWLPRESPGIDWWPDDMPAED